MANSAPAPQALAYPLDLNQHDFRNCNLQGYSTRLDEKSKNLFLSVDATSATTTSAAPAEIPAVDVLQLQKSGSSKVFDESRVYTNSDLERRLSEYRLSTPTSQCRYVAIRGKTSQSQLSITKAMLQTLFSHFQVTPNFLELLFTFGRQEYKKNFHFSGFRARDIFTSSVSTNLTPSASMSTQGYQLCYNLRSVEPTPNPPEWPWSIRQTAIFHSCELKSGNTAWITIKGSKPITDRFKNLTQASAPLNPAGLNTAADGFKASLAVHLSFCEWAGEHWSGFVGFFEDEFHKRTKHDLLATVKRPIRPGTMAGVDNLQSSQTMPQPERRSTMKKVKKTMSKVKTFMIPKLADLESAELAELDVERGRAAAEDDEEIYEYEDFSYDDLRKLQHIQDHANVAKLVITSNVNIMEDLRGFYRNLQDSQEFKLAYGTDCDGMMRLFNTQVTAIVNDLRLQKSRLEALLTLINDHKELLLQLFQHRNMSTNKRFTDKAEKSADKMESLTEAMREIAEKTEKETVFMRIVTIIALFFLPGTFVATVMSTDIVKFQDDGNSFKWGKFSWQAMTIYGIVTISMILATIWAAFHIRKREQSKKLQKQLALAKKLAGKQKQAISCTSLIASR